MPIPLSSEQSVCGVTAKAGKRCHANRSQTECRCGSCMFAAAPTIATLLESQPRSPAHAAPVGSTRLTVRHRTDRAPGQEQTANLQRRRIMLSNAVKDGWQRFLDRLKRLWGKARENTPRLHARG
jgi:hypothetical protein